MMTEQHKAEDLSVAYVQAVAAKAGVNLSHARHDYGVDGTFRQVVAFDGRLLDSGVAVDFQLKASKRWTEEGTHIGYNLEAKTFNDFIRRRATVKHGSPLILVLMCLPDKPEDWLAQTPSELSMRRCCYWYVPAKDAEESDNKDSIKVVIDGGHVLTPEVLTRLLQEADSGRLR